MMPNLRIPKNRPPARPGKLLRTIIDELSFTQQRFADALGITRARLAEILSGRRSITPDTALRLARVLRMSPEFWLNAQLLTDLYEAEHSSAAKEIAKLKQLPIPPFDEVAV